MERMARESIPIRASPVWMPELFKTSMQAYKSGENDDPMMAMFVQTLTDEDIADLAVYYASLPAGE